jgi:hypothetical protein
LDIFTTRAVRLVNTICVGVAIILVVASASVIVDIIVASASAIVDSAIVDSTSVVLCFRIFLRFRLEKLAVRAGVIWCPHAPPLQSPA